MAYTIYAVADMLRTSKFGENSRTGIIESEHGEICFATIDPLELHAYLDKGWKKTKAEVEEMLAPSEESQKLDRKVIEAMSKAEVVQMAISMGLDVEGKNKPVLVDEILDQEV